MTTDDPRVKKNLEELCRTLAVIREPDFIEDFLHCLLTPAETADIAARWALVKALDEGHPQREIAKGLGISLCKITRGSRELKKPNSAFRRVLERIKGTSGNPGRASRAGVCHSEERFI